MIGADGLLARFAESLGRPGDARLYLELFRSDHPERFALIDASGVDSDAARSALAADLIYLYTAGLYPIVLADDPARLVASAPGLPIREVGSPDAARVASRAKLIAIAPADADLEGWVAALESRKVVILGDGGLRRADGELISLVDITSEAAELSADGALAAGERERLAVACHLLEATPHRLTVSLTSPLDLLRELFTVRGAGTLLRPGAIISASPGYEMTDRAGLEALLEAAFGRRPRAELFERPTELVLIADNLAGAAILEPAQPAPYLSKFAVGPAARGEGVARDLWRELERRAPRLFWRARVANPISEWYGRQATGSHRVGPWRVYWRGLEPAELSRAIELAAHRPEDFEPAEPPAPSTAA